MPTGSLSGGVCYENPILATDAHFSALPVFRYYDGNKGTVSQNSFIKVLDVWKLRHTDVTDTGIQTIMTETVAIVPPFAPCYAPSESFADGMLIGWAVAGVLVLVVFVYMARVAMKSHG